jgi:hypothetical protein
MSAHVSIKVVLVESIPMDVELANAMKQHRKESRRTNAEKANQEFDQFQEAASVGGYFIEWKTEYHWNVMKSGKCVAQYWPSVNKWQIVKSGKIYHGDHETFKNKLKQGKL